ncbi:MAG: metallophosphoesterase [Anaerolineae bacterium]|nr:metallophosphoesterase [Anaerolineae bacterium]MDW8173524.1 metallophosphoesterase family protein [Anaerolineae bacterium]
MRLAVFGDIHGNETAFEAMLSDLHSVGDVDKLWVLGDLAAFGPRPGACIARLRALIEMHGKDKCQVIGGNTDRYLVRGQRPNTPPAQDADGLARRVASFRERDDALNWGLAQLSYDDYAFLAEIVGRELSLDVPNHGVVIGFHAIPGDDEPTSLRPDSPDEEAADALLDRQGRLALCGHTHLAMDRQVRSWRVVNPGSVGLSFGKPGLAEWALLTFSEDGALSVDLRAVPYDVEAAIAHAREAGYPQARYAERLRPPAS